MMLSDQHNFVAKAQLDYSNMVCINPNLDGVMYNNGPNRM